jgi:hypothetical protein
MTYRLPLAILFTALTVFGAVAACGSTSSPPGGAPAPDGGNGVAPSPDGTAPTLDGQSPSVDAGTPSSDGSLPVTDGQAPPGADGSIVGFNQTLICFGSGGTGPCSRTVDAPVTFPSTGTFSQILMHVELACPSNGCDPWDRVGSIDLVTEPTTDGGAETLTELGRFITPYGIKAGVNAPPAWDIDVTELRPILAGTVTLRAFIDTWVPQGNAAAYGGGWLLSASFEMTGGTPAKEPIAVVPIWVWTTTGKEPTQIVYGDPGQPIATSLPTQTVTLPAGATSFGVRSTITGHGQGNLDNCAEFCSEEHTWTVGSSPNTEAMWRTDCANFPSQGTYQYSRAGWCPGANVLPWDFDVTSQVGSGATIPVTYGVSDYFNTCNAGAPDGGSCTGCASGESCPYDGSGHTQPFYYVQSLLIGFR